MKYIDCLTEAMDVLATRGCKFLGQAIAYPGTGMTQTFAQVPRDQLIEMPVAEDMQLGMAIGMSIASGQAVVSVYPRINFLMCAMNQLVLHLDAIPRYSKYRPRVIIRTAVATPIPLDPGQQHLGDYSDALARMLQQVAVYRIHRAEDVLPAYKYAIDCGGSSILVEYVEKYHTE